jgi:hypothetical protein
MNNQFNLDDKDSPISTQILSKVISFNPYQSFYQKIRFSIEEFDLT